MQSATTAEGLTIRKSNLTEKIIKEKTEINYGQLLEQSTHQNKLNYETLVGQLIQISASTEINMDILCQDSKKVDAKKTHAELFNFLKKTKGEIDSALQNAVKEGKSKTHLGDKIQHLFGENLSAALHKYGQFLKGIILYQRLKTVTDPKLNETFENFYPIFAARLGTIISAEHIFQETQFLQSAHKSSSRDFMNKFIELLNDITANFMKEIQKMKSSDLLPLFEEVTKSFNQYHQEIEKCLSERTRKASLNSSSAANRSVSSFKSTLIGLEGIKKSFLELFRTTKEQEIQYLTNIAITLDSHKNVQSELAKTNDHEQNEFLFKPYYVSHRLQLAIFLTSEFTRFLNNLHPLSDENLRCEKLQCANKALTSLASRFNLNEAQTQKNAQIGASSARRESKEEKQKTDSDSMLEISVINLATPVPTHHGPLSGSVSALSSSSSSSNSSDSSGSGLSMGNPKNLQLNLTIQDSSGVISPPNSNLISTSNSEVPSAPQIPTAPTLPPMTEPDARFPPKQSADNGQTERTVKKSETDKDEKKKDPKSLQNSQQNTNANNDLESLLKASLVQRYENLKGRGGIAPDPLAEKEKKRKEEEDKRNAESDNEIEVEWDPSDDESTKSAGISRNGFFSQPKRDNGAPQSRPLPPLPGPKKP